MSKQARKSLGWYALFIGACALFAGIGCEMREHKFIMPE